jgi:hypothetical protein
MHGRPPGAASTQGLWRYGQAVKDCQPGTASPMLDVQCGHVTEPAQQRSISTIPDGRSTPRIERNIAASFPWDQRRQPAGIGARAGNGVGRHGTS